MTSAQQESQGSGRAQVVPLRANTSASDYAHAAEPSLSPFRQRLAARKARGLFPSQQRRADVWHWWRTIGLPALGMKLLDSPVAGWREFRGPILAGFHRAVDIWAFWRAAADLDEGIKQDEVEATRKAKLVERRHLKRRANNRLSAGLFVALFALWLFQPMWSYALAIGLVAWFDWLGRHPKDEQGPKRAEPLLLHRGAPLRELARSVTLLLNEQFEVPDLVSEHIPMIWDDKREENIIVLQSPAAVTDAHLRQLERSMGAPPNSMRVTVDPTCSTWQTLRIKRGDALANVPKAPWWDSLSRTIMDAIYIGVSNTDVPFALHMAGAHALCVMKTGGGKTKGFLWSLIWSLSACRDAVIWGIDLRNGPGLRMWRKVIQRVAYTPEDALALLTDLVALMDARHELLAGFAEDDDPANDRDEWHPSLGAYVVVCMDEFSDVAGIPVLKVLLERLIRNGAKVGISLVMCTQKEGTSDFGSTLLQTQVAIKIVGACSPRDSVNLFGVDMRDAGWKPHLLQPAIRGGPTRDAGCCYVLSPSGHETPDVYRCFAPFSVGEVKARARQRMQDGLPQLTDAVMGSDGASLTQPGPQPVPRILAAVVEIFENQDRPEFLPTEYVLANLIPLGWPDLSADDLAKRLTDCHLERTKQRRRVNGSHPKHGYHWADVEAALQHYDTTVEVPR